MISAEMITAFVDKTPQGARTWWDSMLQKGLYINPEDDPAEFCDDEGKRLLDGSACEKIDSIYDEMYAILGESDCLEIGVSAWYSYQGYEWNEASKKYRLIQARA